MSPVIALLSFLAVIGVAGVIVAVLEWRHRIHLTARIEAAASRIERAAAENRSSYRWED